MDRIIDSVGGSYPIITSAVGTQKGLEQTKAPLITHDERYYDIIIYNDIKGSSSSAFS